MYFSSLSPTFRRFNPYDRVGLLSSRWVKSRQEEAFSEASLMADEDKILRRSKALTSFQIRTHYNNFCQLGLE